MTARSFEQLEPDLDCISRLYNSVFRLNSQSEENFWKQLFGKKIERWEKEGILDLHVHNSKVYYDILFEDIVKNCQLGELKGLKILEAGCGTSVLSLLFAAAGANVCLVDRLEEAITYSAIIEKWMRDAGPFTGSVEYRIDDIISVANEPSMKNSFDVVHNYGVLEECTLSEGRHLIAAMGGLSKNMVVVGVPNFFNPYLLQLWGKYGKTSERYFSRRDIETYLRVANLFDVHSFTTACLHPQLNKLRCAGMLGRRGLGFLHVAYGKVSGQER